MRRLLLAALAATALACPATNDPGEPKDAEAGEEAGRDRTDEASTRASTELFYLVTRRDLKKCMFPICGGLMVKELNHDQTTCYGGDSNVDCYVATLDLSALGLSQEDFDALNGEAGAGHAILRGKIQNYGSGFNVGKLAVGAAWIGATKKTPEGGFYQVRDNQIVCITYPCPSLSEITLNVGAKHNIHGLDLTASGASDADLALAQAEINGAGLLVAGTHGTTSGPGGTGTELVASEVYLPVGQVVGEQCGNAVCAIGESCCNASCNMCAPPDGACIQMVCEEACTHGECSQGGALTATCSSCAETVCAADSFCCSDSWDGICVQEAGDLCGMCDAPPPPACVHSECGAGAKLTAACSSCAASVCGSDSFCCNNSWDSVCVTEAEDMCDVCAPPPPTCAHAVCSTGAKLTSGCSSCATAVCNADSYCCSTKWDSICVGEAADLCGGC